MALPPEVITCLQNARFLHLSTCSDNTPHISLMNYTYLPSSPYTSSPSIIMTTTPSSRKTANLLANPRVSLLVHDWVSHRPPTLQSTTTSSTTAPTNPTLNTSISSDPSASSSPLADLLRNLNMSSLSRISTTINGTALLIPANTPAESWLKARHLENNTFGPPSSASSNQRNGDPLSFFSSSPVEERGAGRFMRGGAEEAEAEADGGKACYIEGEEVRVVVVRIRDGRIADWKGGYKDWTVPEAEGEAEEALVNGV